MISTKLWALNTSIPIRHISELHIIIRCVLVMIKIRHLGHVLSSPPPAPPPPPKKREQKLVLNYFYLLLGVCLTRKRFRNSLNNGFV